MNRESKDPAWIETTHGQGRPAPVDPVFTGVKDSGERETYCTGSVRDRQRGKGSPDLMSMVMLLRLAHHYEDGAEKYGDRNWERGQPLSQYVRSLFRHLIWWLMGDDTEDHLAAIAWNCAGLMQTQAQIEAGTRPTELDDLSAYRADMAPVARYLAAIQSRRVEAKRERGG